MQGSQGGKMKKRSILKLLSIAAGAALVLLLVIQLVPYGKTHQNPPVVQEPNWDTPQTRALAKRACYDCHSNETVWPWYSSVAPVSWLVQHDTEEGREKLNFSEWGIREQEAEEAAETVEEGKMPIPIYLVTHPEARLTSEEKSLLIQGLGNTFGREHEGDE
jgi:mono/diheme cytochrome c family protein